MSTLFSRLKKQIKIQKDRINSTITFYRMYGHPIVDIYDTDLVKNAIKRKLSEYQHQHAANDVILEEIADSVVREVQEMGKDSRLKSIAKHENHLLVDIIHNFSIAAAVGALFETKVKFFASKLNVDVYQENDDDFLTTRAFSKISKDIKNKSPRIKVDFEFLANIRNALLHGNLQQLRSIIEPRLTPEQKNSLNPKMSVLFFGQNRESRVRMADEPFTIDEAKDLGPFFWFLSQGNTKLIDLAIQYFDEGINQVGCLTNVHALSFGETQGLYNQLANQGAAWSDNQKSQFINLRGKFIDSEQAKVEKYVRYVHSLFDLENNGSSL